LPPDHCRAERAPLRSGSACKSQDAPVRLGVGAGLGVLEIPLHEAASFQLRAQLHGNLLYRFLQSL
jgi:hypothetical protein